jgi:hypothetical protein
MSKAIRGLASWKLLPLWVALAGLGIWAVFFYYSSPALADDPDVDGDGLPDALEVVIGSNPFDADSDDDSLGDGLEVLSLGSDPTLEDSDGDGIPDGVDPLPCSGVGDEDGRDQIGWTYSTNLDHETLVGTTPFDGIGVNLSSGEFVTSSGGEKANAVPCLLTKHR